MKFYITYFYNVRFIPKNGLPLSTAIWDPKWFHKNMNQDFIFEDKRGVYNGFRIPELSPASIEEHGCSKNCEFKAPNCPFIKSYERYIYSLNFKSILSKIAELAEGLRERRSLHQLPDIYLLVHEKPDDPCSERGTLIKWFKDNSISLMEYNPE